MCSVFLKHHFGRLDHDLDGISFFEPHGFGASPGDDALNEVLPHAHHDMCHYAAELKFLDGTCELIASRKCHSERLVQGTLRCEGVGGEQVLTGSDAASLKLIEVVHDFGIGPVGGADKLAPDDSILVDNVRLGKLKRPVQNVGRFFRIANRQ